MKLTSLIYITLFTFVLIATIPIGMAYPVEISSPNDDASIATAPGPSQCPPPKKTVIYTNKKGEQKTKCSKVRIRKR